MWLQIWNASQRQNYHVQFFISFIYPYIVLILKFFITWLFFNILMKISLRSTVMKDNSYDDKLH